jgi:type I restriction enzyme S subunit
MNNPPGWRETTLRDLCESYKYGYTAKAQEKPVGPKFLRITDIVPDLIDWSSVPYCEIGPDKIKKYGLREGDIVIARTGATTGYAKRIKQNPDAVFASYLVRLRISEEHDNRYIGYVVESDIYKQFIRTNLSGAAQPNANAQVLTSFPVLLPPLRTQRKIAAILSAYDDLIENNTRRIAILEEMAQILYREWFVHFRFPGHEDVPMIDSEFGPIPEEWEMVKMGDITTKIGSGATPRGGKSSYKETGISLIRSLNVYDFRFDSNGLAFIDDEQAERLSNVIVEPQDILLNITGASVARCCMVPSYILPARVNQHVAIVRVNPDRSNPLYVLHTINNHRYKELLLAIAQGGATREALTKSAITDFEIVHPSREVIDKFGAIVKDIFEQQETLQCKNDILRRTRDLLLPRLISGRLDVSDLDIAVPSAS